MHKRAVYEYQRSIREFMAVQEPPQLLDQVKDLTGGDLGRDSEVEVRCGQVDDLGPVGGAPGGNGTLAR